MTWMSPLEASMSVLTTPAPATWMPPFTEIVSSSPCTVAAVGTATASDAVTRPGTTW